MTRLQRRRSPRFAFEAVQWIAPVKEDNRRGPVNFAPVRCHDISKSGFSFWTDAPPDFEEIIVRLQKSTDTIFVKAAIVHVTPHADVEGRKFLVGCRFKERISR